MCDNLYLVVQKKRFPLKNMNTLDVAILLYLSTFMNSDGQIEFPNGVMKNSDNAKLFSKTSKVTMDKWLDLMIKKHVVIYNNGSYLMNNKFFILDNNIDSAMMGIDEKSQYVIPINRDLIRGMYCDFVTHGKSGIEIWIKIHTKIHFKYNVLCHNPYENDVSKLDLFTLVDLAKAMGYSNAQVKRYESLYEVLCKIVFWRTYDMNSCENFVFLYPECMIPEAERIKYANEVVNGGNAGYKWLRRHVDVIKMDEFAKQPMFINPKIYKPR